MELVEKQISTKREKIILIFISIFVFLLNIIRIKEMKTVYLATDEMGYIGIAAYVAGIDWTGVMKYIPYYSYGYSIILYPLVKIFKQPESLYRSIIVLNAIFITLTVPLSYYFMKKISVNINKYVLMATSVTIVLFSSNVVRAHSAMTEALLILCIWCLIYIFYNIDKDESIKNIICFTILLFYTYTVHQRNIVLMIAAAIVITIMYYKKNINLKKYLSFIGTLLLMFFIHGFIKNYVKENIFSNGILLEINDFSGQLDKIVDLFTLKGFGSFLRTFLGHLLYLGSSTYFIGYIGLIYLVKKSCKYIKSIFEKDSIELEQENSQNNNYSYLELFVVLSFIGMFFISCISMIRAGRLDTVFYGRYIEIVVAPILAFGFVKTLENNYNNKKMVIIFSLFFVVITSLLNIVIEDISNLPFATVNSVTLGPFYFDNKLHLLLLCLCTIIVAFIIFISSKAKNIIINIITMISLGCVFFVIGIRNIDVALPYVNYVYRYKETLEKIKSNNNIDYIYYYGDKLTAGSLYIQYIMYDIPVIGVNSEEDGIYKKIFITNNEKDLFLKGNYYLVTEYLSKEILSNYKMDNFINGLFFLSKKTYSEIKLNENIFIIPVNRFSKEVVKRYNEDVISDGKAGYLLGNSPFSMEAGKYNFTIELELVSSKTPEIGSVMINTLGQDEDILNLQIKEENFVDNKIILSVDQELGSRFYDIRPQIYVNEGVILKVKAFSISAY